MVVLLISILTCHINEQINNSTLRPSLWVTPKVPKKSKHKIFLQRPISLNNTAFIRRIPLNNKIPIKTKQSKHLLQSIPKAFSLTVTIDSFIKTINRNRYSISIKLLTFKRI